MAFDEAQYRALIDGLECSEIMLSALEHSARMDAEYYSKRNLLLQERLNAVGAHPLSAYGATLDCSAFYPSITGAYSHDRSKIPFLRVDEIQAGLVRITDNTVFLPEELLRKNSKTIARAYPGDIIIAKGGNTLAKVGLVTDEFPYYAVCRDVIVLRTDRLNGLNPYFLWAFLHSSYGQGILWRSASQTGQPHLTLPAILEIKIPDAGSIAPRIEKCYKESAALQQQSDDLFASARDILRSALKFDRDSISAENTTEKSFSAIAAAGRLDAEYYQPKYDDLFARLHQSPTMDLGSMVDITKSIEPGRAYYGDTGVPFIRVSDLSPMGVRPPSVHIPHDIEPSIERLYPRRDTILFSKDGSVGIAYKVEEDMEAVTSGALLHLRIKEGMDVLPDYLTLVLNSALVRLQAERDASGTVIEHWSLDDIRQIVIPLVPPAVQQEIAVHVQESFVLRRSAQQRLDGAVRAVEIAIEQDEMVALSFLHART